MGEMAEDVAIIKTCHSNFRNDHLKERREGRKDAEFVGIKPETCSSGEVAAFHDTGGDENLGMFLMDGFQAS